MSWSELTDEELIERFARDGDTRWIDRLFTRYHRKVALWCLRMIGERESAADLAQEVFVKVFQKLDAFQGKSRFSTWLYSVTRNHCLNAIKARNRSPERVPVEELTELPDPVSTRWAEGVHRQLESKQLLEFLGRHLSDVESRVMVLHYGEGFSLKAVTRLLKLENRSGAKAYIVSAKRKIDRALQRRNAAMLKESQ